MTDEQQQLHDLIEVNRQYARELLQRCEANGHCAVNRGGISTCEVCGHVFGQFCHRSPMPKRICEVVFDDDGHAACKWCGRA